MRWLVLLTVLGACRKPPTPPDPETTFIATTREMQERGVDVVGARASAVRTTCRHRLDIADCTYVLPRLKDADR